MVDNQYSLSRSAALLAGGHFLTVDDLLGALEAADGGVEVATGKAAQRPREPPCVDLPVVMP